jgi:hypothetical protein
MGKDCVDVHQVEMFGVAAYPSSKFRRICEALAESLWKKDRVDALKVHRGAGVHVKPAWSISIRGRDEHLYSATAERARHFEDGAAGPSVT